MNKKDSKWWIVVAILVAAIFGSYVMVDTFKVANGQFYQDATHTYSDRICKGSRENGSRVCTNYFFTEKQHHLNQIIDQVYKILIIGLLIVFTLDDVFNPSKKEKMDNDPIGKMQTNWRELMKENEEQRKDPAHGFSWTKSGAKTFFGILFLVICFTLIGTYIESSDWFQKILKIE